MHASEVRWISQSNRVPKHATLSSQSVRSHVLASFWHSGRMSVLQNPGAPPRASLQEQCSPTSMQSLRVSPMHDLGAHVSPHAQPFDWHSFAVQMYRQPEKPSLRRHRAPFSLQPAQSTKNARPAKAKERISPAREGSN